MRGCRSPMNNTQSTEHGRIRKPNRHGNGGKESKRKSVQASHRKRKSRLDFYYDILANDNTERQLAALLRYAYYAR